MTTKPFKNENHDLDKEVVDIEPTADMTPESAPEPVEDAKPEQAKPAKKTSTGLAFAGEAVDFSELAASAASAPEPSFPSWTAAGIYDPARGVEGDVDFEDMDQLGRGISNARIAIARVSNGLDAANRAVTIAESKYRKQRALALLGVSGGTVGQREAFADLYVQEAYDDLCVKKAISTELSQRIRSLKFDLDALEVLSNNARARMKL